MKHNIQSEACGKTVFVECQCTDGNKNFNSSFQYMLDKVKSLIEDLKNNYKDDDYDYILSSLEKQASFFENLILRSQ
jgi:hypothetical protein